MADKIGKKARRGSKGHGQEVGLRGAAGNLGNRGRSIDTAVDQAQTGRPAGKRAKKTRKKGY